MNNGILNDYYRQILANSIDHYQSIQHQERLNYLVAMQESQLVTSFNIAPFTDGDQWCFLLGDNIQDGVCGFGETPYKAMLDFNKNFYNP